MPGPLQLQSLSRPKETIVKPQFTETDVRPQKANVFSESYHLSVTCSFYELGAKLSMLYRRFYSVPMS